MIIKGQPVVKSDKYITFFLREPFWSAWQKYGWTKGEPGFGISVDMIRQAHEEGKDIAAVYSGFTYKISPVTANNFYKKSEKKPIFEAKGGVKLLIIPQSKFTREKVFDENAYQKREAERDNTLSLF